MRSFWDRKARENPLWYVHSELDYTSPDAERFWASGEEEVARALDAAGVTGGALAVDVGVGAGRLSRALASRYERVWACDVSPDMTEVARRNLQTFGVRNVTIEAVPGDGTLPLPGGHADLVLSLQVFQHIPVRAATLTYVREAGRVLRPGGSAVFQLRSLLRPDPALGRVERAVRTVVERMRRVRRPPPLLLDSPAWRGSRVGLWELRAAARDGGMRVERWRWISRRGASLLVVCRKP